VKILTPILAFYFLVLFPTANLFLPRNIFIYEFWPILYFAVILLFLIFVLKRVSLKQLGFNNILKAMFIGTLLGIIPIISVIFLDSLFVKSGLSQSDLLIGADLRIPEESQFNISFSENIFINAIVSFFNQVFVVGLVINSLLNKQKTGQALIGGGLLYSLIHLKPSLGNLFLGIISTGLLRITGSIIVPILVQIGFSISETLIIFNYPRLFSILVFFV
jgi:hypothetical protein